MDRSAVNIRDRARMWEKSGWTRFDPKAPVYTADESAASATVSHPGVNLRSPAPKRSGSHLLVMAGLVPAMAFQL